MLKTFFKKIASLFAIGWFATGPNVGALAKDKESELIKIVRNTFEGFKLIILFGKKKLFQNKFEETLLTRYKYEILQQAIQKIPRLIFEIFFAGM